MQTAAADAANRVRALVNAVLAHEADRIVDQTLRVRDAHPAELLLPRIERGSEIPWLAAEVRHLHPGLLFTQHADDLLLSEPASFHPSVPLRGCGLYLYLEEFPGLRSPIRKSEAPIAAGALIAPNSWFMTAA